MIYLTSDLHFGHKNIINYCTRPWDNIDDMDRNLIASINSIVGITDTLYILGDFTMHGSYTKCMNYREQIDCQNVHLILGNHDNGFIEKGKRSPFSSERDYLELIYNGVLFCLSHYPFVSWKNKERGSIMCHGHVHYKSTNNLKSYYQGIKRYDVGVDANLYKPVLIDRIIDFFKY